MDFFHVIGQYIADSWHMLIGGDRAAGPFHLRLILQPVIATILGIRAGRRDARAGHPPYFWSVATAGDRTDRQALIRHGWSDIGKVFSIAIALDVIYELVVYHWVYPVQAIIVASILALIPYLLMRGLANRLTKKHVPTAKH